MTAAARDTLTLRILSTLVLAPIAIGAVVLGGWYLVALGALFGLAAVHEWDRLCGGPGLAGPVGQTHAAIVMIAAILAGLGRWNTAVVLALIGALALLAVGRRLGRRAAWPACGVLYIALPVVAFLWLRDDRTHGLSALIWVLVVVWASDIGAFAAGRLLGGPRLAPRISPAKTWSGAVGGVLAAAAAGAATSGLTHSTYVDSVVPVSIALGIVAQAGDLAESAVKRHFGVKNSGTLIPGHGGVLDRVDSLLFALPAAALIALLNNGSALVWR